MGFDFFRNVFDHVQIGCADRAETRARPAYLLDPDGNNVEAVWRAYLP